MFLDENGQPTSYNPQGQTSQTFTSAGQSEPAQPTPDQTAQQQSADQAAQQQRDAQYNQYQSRPAQTQVNTGGIPDTSAQTDPVPAPQGVQIDGTPAKLGDYVTYRDDQGNEYRAQVIGTHDGVSAVDLVIYPSVSGGVTAGLNTYSLMSRAFVMRGDDTTPNTYRDV